MCYPSHPYRSGLSALLFVIIENSTWGSKFLRNLSNEIISEFPFSKGFSVSNLKNMAKFYREYCDVEIGQTPSVQIPWSHNLEILRVKSKEQRLWYILLSKEKEFNRKLKKVVGRIFLFINS